LEVFATQPPGRNESSNDAVGSAVIHSGSEKELVPVGMAGEHMTPGFAVSVRQPNPAIRRVQDRDPWWCWRSCKPVTDSQQAW
jgi:hypothetical protein